MIILQLPVKPIVKKYFEKHYPEGYVINFKSGINKAIFALVCRNINTGHYKKSMDEYTAVVEIKVPHTIAFSLGARFISPFTIAAINQIFEEDIIKRDFKRDLTRLRERRVIFKKNNPANFYKHAHKEIFKYSEEIKSTMTEHGLSEEEVNIHSLKKMAVRTK